MVHRIILSTVILTLNLNLIPSQLQASPLKFINRLFQQPAVPGVQPDLFPLGTFPDFRASFASRWTGSLRPNNGYYLENLLAPKLPVKPGRGALPQPDGAPALASSLLKPDAEPNLPNRVMAVALNKLQTPYRWGGSLLSGRATDCSGFVKYVYHNFRIDLPHSSAAQARMGKVAARAMDFSKLEVGDLLFFSRARAIDHVGIYAGEGKMIHASSRRRSVIVTDLRQPYYAENFVVAKRLLGKP